MAWVRLVLAIALLILGATPLLSSQAWMIASPRFRPDQLDPAILFYGVGAVALGLRVFWARYLVICFATALLSMACLWRPSPIGLLTNVALVALLSGPSMRALFEERTPDPRRWAATLDPRVQGLRVLFIVQSVALAILFGARPQLSSAAGPTVVLAGVAIAGLVFQRTWAVLCMTAALGLEAYVGVTAMGGRVQVAADVPWAIPALLLMACGGSLIVLAPFQRAIWRQLRHG
jgi:hypothetical protein